MTSVIAEEKQFGLHYEGYLNDTVRNAFIRVFEYFEYKRIFKM